LKKNGSNNSKKQKKNVINEIKSWATARDCPYKPSAILSVGVRLALTH
jgi:hypothetical protein